MKYLLTQLVPVACCLLLLAGCIKEDLSDCPPATTRLHFAYADKCNPEAVYPADIDSLHLFVFDANGLFTAEFVQSDIQIGKDYSCKLPLPAGKHTIVTWAGTGNAYQLTPAGFVAGTTTFGEALLRLRKGNGGSTPDSVLVCRESLYFGLDTVEAGASHLVQLTKNTTGIRVSVSGMNAQDTYRLCITGDDNCFKFDNSCTSQGKLNYIQPLVPNGEGKAQAYSCMLNPGVGNHPSLSLTHAATGKEVFSGDLVQLITERIADVDFGCMHEFEIEFVFIDDDSFTISINGWSVNETDEEL